MIINNDTRKPCLVETRQGLSVLYENRYLYSKYNPAASIERLVDSLEFKNDTLVLCFSPILGYGLKKLAEKLPSGCFMLAIEADVQLLELYNTNFFTTNNVAIDHISAEETLSKSSEVTIGFLGPQRLDNIYNLLTKKNQITDNGVQIPHPGSFKYCVRVDFSAAPALKQEEYQRIQQRAELAVANFWKNRLTLIKMGRLYHRNILRNLAILPFSNEIPTNKIDFPLLVLGAGPSADKTIAKLSLMTKVQREKMYIVAVDAVVPALLAQKIKPNLVVALECQHAIQQAYTSAVTKELFIVADLTSRPSILHYDTSSGFKTRIEQLGENCTGGKIAFFSTEFTGSRFLERLQQQGFIRQVLPPMGSVGVVAMEIALLLRSNSQVPVYVSGLDFSFLVERSHCKDSFQVKNSFFKTNRVKTAGSYGCLGNPSTEKQAGKSGMVYSDQILSYYQQIFCDRFQGVVRAYDVGEMGLDLGLKRKDFSLVISEITQMKKTNTTEVDVCKKNTETKQQLFEKIQEFYYKEEVMLQELREGLSTGNISQERILEILEEADYLYLHFPDGYKPSLDISFLKRVRSEIDFFLKDIALGKKLLEE
ncbi:MAG: DUF115 domain-containing protein [Treponema sp.]|nr:DUF115 domain-containing protein [Treponema sp.]